MTCNRKCGYREQCSEYCEHHPKAIRRKRIFIGLQITFWSIAAIAIILNAFGIL